MSWPLRRRHGSCANEMSTRRIVEGVYVDEGYTNGLQQIFDLLWRTKDLDLVERWGVWLLQRDRALGLKVRRR